MAAEWKNCTRVKKCPICEDIGRGSSHQRCAFTDDGAYHCFRSAGQGVPGFRIIKPMSSFGGTIYRASDDERVRRELSAEQLEEQRREEEVEWAKKVQKARAVWELGVHGHPTAAAYFDGRLPAGAGHALPTSVRFYGALPFYDGQKGNPGPAVLCAMTNVRGEVTAVHRIYLQPGENPPTKRRGTDAPKQMLGKPLGSGVRFPARDGSCDRVIVCEGIETGRALNVAMGGAGWHVIAGFSGAGMMKLELDEREAAAEVLIVAGDYDEYDKNAKHRPGATFANITANNLRKAYPTLGRVVVAIPSHADLPEAIDVNGEVLCGTKGVDWEDVARFYGCERVRALVGESSKAQSSKAANEEGGGGEGNGTDGTDGTDGGDGGTGGGGGDWGGDDAVLEKGDLARARKMISTRYMFGKPGERFTVAYDYADQQWYVFVGTHWEARSDEEMRSEALRWCEPYVEERSDGRREPVGLSAKAAENLVRAIQVDAGVRVEQMPVWIAPTIDRKMRPLWMSGQDDWGAPVVDPQTVIPLKQGLLNVDAWLNGTVALIPHTPRYLSSARPTLDLDVEKLADYLRDDPMCEDRGERLVKKLAPTWVDVLDYASEGDAKWQECLGRAFGISLTPDVTLERIFFIEGPPGSSKGTVFEGLVSMLGEDLVATTSIDDICEKFETSAWRGRRVVGMTDASVGKKTDAKRAVEILKNISGGDPIRSEKKYQHAKPFWRPNVHLWIVSNDLITLPDPSLSLRRRLVTMPTRTPVGTKQDPRVKARVRNEGAGILVWALCHLKALHADRAAGRDPFEMSAAGKKTVELFSRNSSPIAAFLGDCCRVDAGASVSTKLLYAIYRRWCQEEGKSPWNAESFGGAMRSLVPGSEKHRVSWEGERPYVYTGLRPILDGEQVDGPNEFPGKRVMAEYGIAAHLVPSREHMDELPGLR